MLIKIIGIITIAVFLMHLFCHWAFRSVDLRRTNRRLYDYMPVFESDERHKITINATPEKIFEAIHSFDMGNSPIVKFFLFLRGALSILFQNKPDSRKTPKFTLEEITANGGMILLEEVENQEVVLGMSGKFWKPKAEVLQFESVDDFINFNQTGFVKVAWNFYIEKNGDGTTTLSTETRNLCYGEKAKSRFRIYWWVIRPYSGWIRIEILKMIKKQAEK